MRDESPRIAGLRSWALALSVTFFAAPGIMAQARAGSASTQTAPVPAAPAQPAPQIPQAPEFASDIVAEKISFATEVSSRVPVGVSDVFDAGHNVYCWNLLSLNKVPADIRHEWYWNGQKVSQSVFHVHYAHTRVWSMRKVRPGQWRVDIKDAGSGRLIAVGAFVVRKS